MDIKDELKSLLGRDVSVIPTTFQNKKGFMAEYFNYTDRNCVSELFSETEEGAMENLLKFLKKRQPGGTDGTNSSSK